VAGNTLIISKGAVRGRSKFKAISRIERMDKLAFDKGQATL